MTDAEPNMINMNAAVALDPLTFPLHGSRLIEASAGTGKTYTIATLYVRLVLGHGGDQAFARPLTPPEILVVTFTEAATQELRDRIRARLVQAAQCFEAVDGDQGADSLLLDLRESYEQKQWPSCARQLRLAAEWMDESAVSTIHSWCYRMLREHAFDSGSLFKQELVTDEQDLLEQSVRDYWRRHFYALSPAAVVEVLHCCASPEALFAALRPLLGRPDAVFTVDGVVLDTPQSLDAVLDTAVQWRQAIKALENKARETWAADAQGLREMLIAMRPDLNATTFAEAKSDEKFEAWLGALAHWAATGECGDGMVSADPLGAAPLKLKRLAQGRIKLKGKKPTPEHLVFQFIEDWCDQADHPPDIMPALVLHALRDVRRILAREKDRRAELGFDDLLARLDAALGANVEGEGQGQPLGASLAMAIRQRFPVALIDEFQDTDPLQYRIFSRVYPSHVLNAGADETASASPNEQGKASAGLFMIGDPKQAIYAFRGADIQTYLAARAATQGRHYTLGTNFRSTMGMVAAVNHAFGYAEEHHARGAFRFGHEAGGNPVPFLPVKARGRDEWLEINGSVASALTAWLLDAEACDATSGVIGTTRYRDEMAERAATSIRNWLALAREGRAGLRKPDGGLQALRPADIAILVRGRTEAEAMRQALARRQIASVYLSDQDSVFSTPEAVDVRQWLQACADPASDGLLRTALATATLGMAWRELDDIHQDELRWEALAQRVRDYQRVWRRQGVLPMLWRWLADFGVAARLLARPDGERWLTNVLHVAEWLQRQSAELDGENALIRALGERIAQPTQEEILRLESDADLIKIVTIHKSKGLEYPLVLLPFISGWREVDGRASWVGYHVPPSQDASEGGHASLRAGDYAVELLGGKNAGKSASKSDGSTASAIAQADDERLSEDMRLLYVALTRARHAVWLGVAPLAAGATSKSCGLHKGALGYLLAGGREIAADELPALLKDWQSWDTQSGKNNSAIAIVPAPQADAEPLPPVRVAEPGPARAVAKTPVKPWWIASYSALRVAGDWSDTENADGRDEQDGNRNSAEPASAREADLRERHERSDDLDASAPPKHLDEGSPHAFPKGAEPGSFLHGLLEQAAALGFAKVVAEPQLLRDVIGRRCAVRGLEAWIDPLADWLRECLVAPLPSLPSSLSNAGDEAGTVALSDLGVYQCEMEFWFAASDVQTRLLDALVSRHTLGGLPRAALLPETLNGMLKGYMDLVFEHEGRFYIADYKSNWLGADDGAYTEQVLADAMRLHRYDLQYALYTLALHRLLRSRVPDYDYDRHMGGVMYLFLRGIQAPGRGVFADKPERGLIEALDALFESGVMKDAAREGLA